MKSIYFHPQVEDNQILPLDIKIIAIIASIIPISWIDDIFSFNSILASKSVTNGYNADTDVTNDALPISSALLNANVPKTPSIPAMDA